MQSDELASLIKTRLSFATDPFDRHNYILISFTGRAREQYNVDADRRGRERHFHGTVWTTEAENAGSRGSGRHVTRHRKGVRQEPRGAQRSQHDRPQG